MIRLGFIVMYTAVIVLYFIGYFMDSTSVMYVTGLLTMAAIGVSFREAIRLYQVVGVLFLAFGLILYVNGGYPLVELPLYMTSTVHLLGLLYVLPFINSVIVVGRYDRMIHKIFRIRAETIADVYKRSVPATVLLASFLNFATLPLVHSVLRKLLADTSRRVRNMVTSRVVLRGFAMAMAWSPMEMLVALTVDLTGVAYMQILPWLVLFAVIMLAINLGLSRQYRRFPSDESGNDVSRLGVTVLRRISSLFVYLIGFVTAIVTVSNGLNLGFIMSVTLVVIPFSFVWALLIGRIRSYRMFAVRRWQERVSRLQSFAVLFLSLGLFITMFSDSALLDIIQGPFLAGAERPLLLFLTFPVLCIGLAMIGFHPLVTLSILGAIVQPLLTEINPVSLAIVLITSSLSTSMVGPYNVTVSIMGSLVRENPYQVSLWNLGYALVYTGVGITIGYVLL